MGRRKIKKSERFTPEYKKSRTDYINTIFSRLINERHNGKDYTVHMITNWFYGRNENPALDDVFEAIMKEEDPEGLAKDRSRRNQEQFASA